MNRDALRLAAAVDVTSRATERLKSSIVDDRILIARAIADPNVEQDKELLRALDAFVQRFQQVHEHMTHRLYPAFYRVATAGDRPPALRDLFVWLERFKFFDSGLVWVERTELRNRLIHEYPLDAADRILDLQAAVELSSAMMAEFDRVITHIADRNILENGNA
ncbi:hypothetical protein H5J25_18260 [Sphingomonas aliaeris]|uniref:Nucleotidyltransferase n=1 Tax=Sphingomonas aliaeris TaxID=2759526 RepID=A0A974NUV9_9SPHN|nr:hypothetical protein [Sphingomonas aliaeris]QQV77228.1 hypothetical protein H5J25_18260 [Sphingomonas aliaeris]